MPDLYALFTLAKRGEVSSPLKERQRRDLTGLKARSESFGVEKKIVIALVWNGTAAHWLFNVLIWVYCLLGLGGGGGMKMGNLKFQ